MYIHIKNVISERLLFPPTTYLHYIHAYKHIYVHTCIHAFIYRYVHTCAAQTISNQRVYVYILPSPGIDILGGCGSGSEHHRCRHSHHLRSDGALQGRNTHSLRKTTTCMMYACMYVCMYCSGVDNEECGCRWIVIQGWRNLCERRSLSILRRWWCLNVLIHTYIHIDTHTTRINTYNCIYIYTYCTYTYILLYQIHRRTNILETVHT